MRLNTTSSLLAIALLTAMSAGPARAATATAPLNVRITLTNACNISATAPTDVNFGSVASSSQLLAIATGTITATCTLLTPYTIGLSAGANASTANDVNTRRMKNTNAAITTGNHVGYQLYQDVAGLAVWGNTIGAGGNVVSGIGLGLPVPTIVYGQIANPSVNNAAAGDYLDVVTATITY